MASVMPTQTYPKIYQINEKQHEIHNSAEDTSFQALPRYFAAITTATYPKILYLGGLQIHVKSSAEETAVRAYYAQG